MADNVENIRSKNFDYKGVEPYVRRYFAKQESIDDIMSEAKTECQPLKDDQKEIIKEAAEAGFPKGVFKTAKDQLKDAMKYNARASKLNEDMQNELLKVQKALKMPEQLGFFDAIVKDEEAA